MPPSAASLRSAAVPLVSLAALLAALGCRDRVPPAGIDHPPDDVVDPMAAPPDPGANAEYLPKGPAVMADPAPPAIQGGTLFVTKQGVTAVVSDPDRDHLYVVDLNLRTLRHDIILDPGDQPGRAAEDDQGFVHVALRRGGAIVRVDPVHGGVDLRRPVCPAPSGIAFDEQRKLLHVACETGELVSMAPNATVAQSVVDLGRDLRDVAVHADGTLWVTRFRSADVLLVRDGKIVTTAVVPVESVPESVCPLGGSRQTEAAWRLRLGGAKPLMLHQRTLDQPAGYYGPPPCPGEHRVAAAFTTFTDAGLPAVTTVVPHATLVTDVAESHGKLALAITGHSWGPSVLANVRVLAPGAEAPPLERRLPGEITAVAFDAAGNLVAQSREPAALYVVPTDQPNAVMTTIALGKTTRFDTGLAMFHLDSGIGITCASCHPAGRDDGHTWLFSVGPRRTQSLAQRLADTAPYHWDGKIANLHDFMADVFTGRMSGAHLDDAQNDAFQHWVKSPRLAALRAPIDAAAVQRGRGLFEGSAGCSQCHSGLNLTNNLSFDVGTGMTAQVPSLLGVGARLPLMHTGCAKTLAERFDPACGGKSHGHTDGLAAGDIADLVAYLDSL